MTTVNLAYPNASTLAWKHIKFPDGQQNIVLYVSGLIPLDHPIRIMSRMNNFMDLELIICAKKALDRLGYMNVSLFVPYFLGSRSDRLFENGSTSYLKDVLCPIINSLKFKEVECLDPHSQSLTDLLDNFSPYSNLRFVGRVLHHYLPKLSIDSKDLIVISPDAGAGKKIFDILRDLNFPGSHVEGSKHRNLSTGEIIGMNLHTLSFEGKPVLIIDDICDGGRTFIEIAKKAKELNAGPIFLAVTHGIFSNDAHLKLHKEGIQHIYSTNSYSDFPGTYSYLTIENVFHNG